jgi:hypothetical protein
MTRHALAFDTLTLQALDNEGMAACFEQAAMLLACGASRRAAATGLTLHTPCATLRIEPIEWVRCGWHVSAALRWPRRRDATLWARAFLDANAELMGQGCLAFGADDDGELQLLGRLYAGREREQELVRQLRTFHDVCAGVHGLRCIAGDASVDYAALVRFVVPAPPAGPARPEFDPVDLIAEMGVPEPHACQIVAAGRLQMSEGDVNLEVVDGGRGLLLWAHLGHGLLDGEGLSALQVNGELVRGHGIAVAHGPRGHRLLAYWPGQGRPAADLEECLSALAGLPSALHEDRTVRDAADTDFTGPMSLE